MRGLRTPDAPALSRTARWTRLHRLSTISQHAHRALAVDARRSADPDSPAAPVIRTRIGFLVRMVNSDEPTRAAAAPSAAAPT